MDFYVAWLFKIQNSLLIKCIKGLEEIVDPLKVLAVLPEDQGSVSSTQIRQL